MMITIVKKSSEIFWWLSSSFNVSGWSGFIRVREEAEEEAEEEEGTLWRQYSQKGKKKKADKSINQTPKKKTKK